MVNGKYVKTKSIDSLYYISNSALYKTRNTHLVKVHFFNAQ